MTLLEFCKNFFPDEEIFTEHGETITVNTKKLLDLEQAGKDSGQVSWFQVTPSTILRLLEPGDWQYYDPRPGACCGCWDGTEQISLSEENARRMRRLQIVIDPEVAGMDFDVRRPYFRMRGRPVTEEQAFDIIRRTDCGWAKGLRGIKLKDEVSSWAILDNTWFGGTWCQGWVWPNGLVGMNGHSGIKYPDESELVDAILPLMLAFPYLDLMIGITDWDEAPDYAWDDYFDEDYPDFEENIVYGIWLHDRTLELMAPARAREKYAEYRRLYSGPNEDIFKRHYYIHPADFEYLKRCIRSHGLDPEEVLAGYEWDPVRGLQRRRDVLREQEKERKSETEIRWQKMLEQQQLPAWELLDELDGEQRRTAITERLVQIWELGWSTLPEPVLALKREAQALMKEAGVPDWTRVCICHAFVPGGADALRTPKGSRPDPPAECIKEYAGDTVSEELQETLFGLLMRMKREWESAPEPGPGKHRKELEHESG